MARLDKNPYPGIWDQLDGEDVGEYFARTDKMLNAISRQRLVRFPVGDGYAFYFAKKFKPLILQWIPYGDKWQAPYAWIRGTRLSDVYDGGN